MLNKLKCWWKHDWRFMGGRWVVPKDMAMTERQCFRCGPWQEVQQNHDRIQAYFFGSQELSREEFRKPGTPGKYDTAVTPEATDE